MPLVPGTLLAVRYSIVEVLGEGAMSTVYLATSPRAKFAIKAFDPRGGTDTEIAEARQLFEQEIQLLQRLDHPCIPKLHEAFTDNGIPYFAMDYIDGRTLESIVDKNGPAPESYVLPIAIQLLELLAWLHDRPDGPIVFRDLKPSNVMVDYEGRVHLIDFGVARKWKPGKLTDTFPLGTPGFAAPEQYGRAQSGPSTDLYAWAATIHRTLTGLDPDPTTQEWPPLRSVAPNNSEDMEQILDRCLRLDPNQRYQTAEPLLSALERLRQVRHPNVDVPPIPVAVVQPSGPLCTSFSLLHGMTGGALVVAIFGLLVWPFFVRSQHHKQLTYCKSNLKNIATALEMYAADYRGRYPPELTRLSETYLMQIPTCPTVGKITYTDGYAVSSDPDTFTVLCSGYNHESVGQTANYPRYTSKNGLLLER